MIEGMGRVCRLGVERCGVGLTVVHQHGVGSGL